MNDEKLTEYYPMIKSILVANNFKIESCKSIDFGLQFNLSQDGKSGFIRIYLRRNGTFTIDYSPMKDQELLRNVQQLLEKRPPAVSFSGGTSSQPGNNYDAGYPVIGTDESGKGDYFGPLVCAAVCVDETSADELRSIGVRDSKTCSDREIPEGIAEYNQAKEEMCRETVANFPKIIKKARESSKNANNPVSDHIVDANKMVPQLFSPHGNTL